MKGPSETAKALIEELNQQPGFLSKLTGRAPDRVELLHRLAELNEPKVIPYVFWLVLQRSSDVARAAARTVHSLLSDLSPKLLLEMDEAIRQHFSAVWSSSPGFDYYLLKPSTLKKLTGYGEASTSLLGIASFAANGYVREAAINELAAINTGQELVFLLIRLNDWVRQVQVAAQNAVSERLNPSYAERFIENIPLVMRLVGCTRHDHSALIDGVQRLLKDDRCRDQLVGGLSNRIPQVRRFCVELLFTVDGLDRFEWTHRVAKDRDPFVRFFAVRHIRHLLADDEIRAAFELFKNDRFMPVRREIYDAIAERFGPSASEDELRQVLFDKHRSMRELARYYLARIDGVGSDFASLYRLRIRDVGERDPTGAVLGLAETGSEADDELILPFLSHDLIRVRRATIRALARLATKKHLPVFRELLLQGTPGISKDAREAIIPNANLYGGERLWRDFQEARESRVRNHLITIINRLAKWDRLALLLKVLARGTDEEKERAADLVSRWLTTFNQSFSTPTKDQDSEITTLLSEIEGCFGKRRLFDELRFYLPNNNKGGNR